MTRTTYLLFHLSNALVALTGLVYAWMKYFCTSDEPFAVVNHPWQPGVQHLHVIVAPLLVLMIGLFWQMHAAANWRGGVREGRRSGWLIWCMAIPMIMSGYLLQTAVSDLWREIWLILHLATSVIWIVSGTIHIFIHWRRKMKPA